MNPDGVANQVEGGVLQTVSRSLMEAVDWDTNRVKSVDWVSYPIMRHTQAPEVEIALIDRPGTVAWGAGEPTAPPSRRPSQTRCSMPPARGCVRFRSRRTRSRRPWRQPSNEGASAPHVGKSALAQIPCGRPSAARSSGSNPLVKSRPRSPSYGRASPHPPLSAEVAKWPSRRPRRRRLATRNLSGINPINSAA